MRWKAAFPGGFTAVTGSSGGGVQVDSGTATPSLLLDYKALAESVDALGGTSLAWVERAVVEEVIHSVAVQMEARGELDMEGLWNSLPAEMQAQVRAAYPTTSNALNLGHEFFRMVIQQRLAGQKPKKGQPVLTEQAMPPAVLAKLSEVLERLLAYFRDLAATLRSQNASADTVGRVTAAADMLEAGVRALQAPTAPAPDAPPELNTPADLKGEKIDKEWTAFADSTRSLGIPRDQMPQIKTEHRGALANFLRAGGIQFTFEEVLPGTLHPTQAEYSPAKVAKAREFVRSDADRRAILVSSDDHILDGHHQWLAELAENPDKPMDIRRLGAPIRDLLKAVALFPSAGMEAAPEVAAPASQTESYKFPSKKAAMAWMKENGIEKGSLTPIDSELFSLEVPAGDYPLPKAWYLMEDEWRFTDASDPDNGYGLQGPWSREYMMAVTGMSEKEAKAQERKPKTDAAPEAMVTGDPEGKYSVYPMQRQDGMKWMLQAGEKRGFGDYIFDTEEQARTESARERQRDTDRQNTLRQLAEKEAADTAKKEAAETLGGFEEGMTPMQKGAARKALANVRNYRGTLMTRRDLIRSLVGKGYTVQVDNGARRLTSPEGSFLGQDVLSKTGLDYAEWLVSENATPEAEPDTITEAFRERERLRTMPIKELVRLNSADSGLFYQMLVSDADRSAALDAVRKLKGYRQYETMEDAESQAVLSGDQEKFLLAIQKSLSPTPASRLGTKPKAQGPPPATGPALTPEEAALKAIMDGVLDGGISAQPVSQTYDRDFPDAAYTALSEAARNFVKAGNTTPEQLAASLTKMGPQYRAFTEAIWSGMGMASGEIRAMDKPDWAAIYETLDKPAEINDTTANGNTLVQRPEGSEAGNPPPVVPDSDPAGDQSGGRMDGQDAETDAGNGSSRDAGSEDATSGPDRGGRGSGSEPEGNDAPESTGDIGDGWTSDAPATGLAATNYVILPGDKLGQGTLTEKYADNIRAIKLVKHLQATGKVPTQEGKAILVKYVGWGGIKGVFNPDNKQWGQRHRELKALLTPEEYAAARASQTNAHYTSETVITRGVWAAMKRFGFTGGKMIEGGVGIGHFIGLMPASIRSGSQYTGVEKDLITAAIAGYLYPQAKIWSMGFEEAKLSPNSADGAVGNPPFGQQNLYDSQFKDISRFSIHNFFIAKQIALLRPGAVAGFVVSHNFLDALDPTARETINKSATFLGAIRLPNTAFQENANTEVVTDLVFFKKAPGVDDVWTKSSRAKGSNPGEDYSINDWVEANPDMVLGTVAFDGGMWSANEYTLNPFPDSDLGTLLDTAVAKLPEGVYEQAPKDVVERLTTPVDMDAMGDTKVGGYFVAKDGEIHQRLADVDMERRSMPSGILAEGSKKRMRGMILIRDTMNKLVAAEMNDETPKVMDAYRKRLNVVYDAFVKEHGPLNVMANRRLFYNDPQSARILGLETDFDAGVSKGMAKKNGVDFRKPTANKAAIFSKRTNVPYKEITKVETSVEALATSLNQRGAVLMDYMMELTGFPASQIEAELEDLVFELPEGGYEQRELYLAGNVRRKLNTAREAAEKDERFQKNVVALEKVQPAPIMPEGITAPLGSGWIPPQVYSDFANELVGERPDSITYLKSNGGWSLKMPDKSLAATQTYGVPPTDAVDGEERSPGKSFGEILSAVMNGKPTTVWITVDKKRVVHVTATAAAAEKAAAIKDEWERWLFRDEARRDALTDAYNLLVNNYADASFNGSHLKFPGKSALIELRKHQKDVAWRIITQGSTLLDHVVGAGKTFAGIAAFGEMRRLGRVKKPLFVVPNHLVTQWRDDFIRFYPNANVLYARPSDFAKDKRKLLFAKILTGSYDAIIIGHSNLVKIGMDPAGERELLQEMVAEIMETIGALNEDKANNGRAIAQMEKTKESLQAKLARLADRGPNADSVATFEELGIDALFVDEAHEFKNLFYTTQMQRVAGLGNPAGAAKSFDLYLKTRQMRKRFGPKAPVVFATGTPISNSLVEMFTVQRYLQPDVLTDLDARTLDAWVKLFGNIDIVDEVDPTGTGYRLTTRFKNFHNVGDLSAIYKTTADVITQADLIRQALEEDPDKPFPLPKIEGGSPRNFTVNRSQFQEDYYGVETQVVDGAGNGVFDTEGEPYMEYPQGTINWRIGHMPADPRMDNMLKLTSDARKAALDMRLVNPDLPDVPESKINLAVKNILGKYKEWDADKGTQLVFCDLSIPSSAKGKAKKKLAEAKKTVFWFKTPGGGLEIIPSTWKPAEVAFSTHPDDSFAVMNNKRAGKWTVFERTTGVAAAHGSTKSGAIALAKQSLENISSAQWERLKAQNAIPDEELAAFLEIQQGETPDSDASDESDTAEEESTEISLDELMAEQSTFSVYDDVRDKLIAGGIPAEEIAFIHDYDNQEKKSKLFSDVRAGRVRILMGSTPKLGAGTNVQNKLVALHHLDAPWRPSDLEQREGRIIRQGNEFQQRDPKGFEVLLARYGTNLTYDTRMWQIIENKAAGIEAFKMADRSTRMMEDFAGEAATAADMKAATSGNPLIREEINLRTALEKLVRQEKAWQANQYTIARSIQNEKQVPGYVAAHRKNIQDRIDVRDANTPEKFSLKIKSPLGEKVTTFDEKKGIASAFAALIKPMTEKSVRNETGGIASYRGFSISLDYHPGWKELGIYFSAQGVPKWRAVELGQNDSLSDVGLIQRFDNELDGLERQRDARDAQIPESIANIAKLEEAAKAPFTKGEELNELRRQHTAVKGQLMQSRKAAAPRSATGTSGTLQSQPPSLMGEASALAELPDDASAAAIYGAAPLSVQRAIAQVPGKKGFEDWSASLVPALQRFAEVLWRNIRSLSLGLVLASLSVNTTSLNASSRAVVPAAQVQALSTTNLASVVAVMPPITAFPAPGALLDGFIATQGPPVPAPKPQAPAPKPARPKGTVQEQTNALTAGASGASTSLPLELQKEWIRSGKHTKPLLVAASFLGEREGQNATLAKIFTHYGIEESQDAYPWCATFTSFALSKSGIPTKTFNARGFLAKGEKSPTPERGDIVVMWNDNPKTGGRTGYGGHVGFYVGETPTHYMVLSGNANDEVNITAFPRSRVLGVRQVARSTLQAQSPADILRDAGVSMADVDALAEEASWEYDGIRTIGDPTRAGGAGVGIENSELNDVMLAASKIYADALPDMTPQKLADLDAVARQVFDANPDGELGRLINSRMAGESTGALDMRMAQMAKEWLARQPATADRRAQAAALAMGDHLAKRTVAQELGAARDMWMTKAERFRAFMFDHIYLPPPAVREAIKQAPDAAAKAKIMADDQKRLQRIVDALAKMGLTVDDLLGGGFKLVAKRDEMNRAILKDMDATRSAIALDAMDATLSFKDIAAKRGVTVEVAKAAKAEAMKRVRDELMRRRQMAQRAAGIISTQPVNSDLMAEMDFAALAKMTDAEANAEADRIMREMGWFPDSQQGKRRTKKRRTPVRGSRQPGRAGKAPAVEFEDEIVSVFHGMDIGDQVDVVRMKTIVDTAEGRGLDIAREIYINFLLSGPVTQTTNFIGNVAFGTYNLLGVRAAEAGLNALTGNKLKGNATGAELFYIFRAALPALLRGAKMFSMAWGAEHDFFEDIAMGTSFKDSNKGLENLGGRKALSGTKGRIIRMPGRALLAADSGLKSFFGTMEVAAHAYRLSKAEGLKPGTPEFETSMNRMMYVAGSPAWEAAVRAAEYNAFQQPLDEKKNPVDGMAKWVADLSKSDNWVKKLIGTAFFPFVKTPYNIAKTAVTNSPLGSFYLAYLVAKGGIAKLKDGKPFFNGDPEFVQTTARQVLAWTAFFMIRAISEGDEGDDQKKFLITGSPPKSRAEADLQRRALGGAYRVKIGNFSFNYGRLEPFATVLASTVDLMRSIKRGDDASENATKLWTSLAYQAQNKTFLTGLASIGDLMEGRTYGLTLGEMAQRKLLGIIVPNLIKQPLRNWMDTEMDTKNAPWWHYAIPVPFAVPTKVDATGKEKLRSGNAFTRMIFPSTAVPDAPLSTSDRVLKEWNRTRKEGKGPDDEQAGKAFSPGEPDRQITIGKQTIELNPETYRAMAERAGKLATKMLENAPLRVDQESVDRIRKAYAQARAYARNELKSRPIETLGTVKK